MKEFIIKPGHLQRIELWAATTIFVFSIFFLINNVVDTNKDLFDQGIHFDYFSNYFFPQLIGFIVRSWLAYRMKGGAGKASSQLDKIRPSRWTAAMTSELLELLWAIERTLSMQPDLDAVLTEVIASPTIPAADLPQPAPRDREPPSIGSELTLEMFGDA